MINFICTYCKKQIIGVTIIIDKTHIVHSHCEVPYLLTQTKMKEDKNKLVQA